MVRDIHGLWPFSFHIMSVWCSHEKGGNKYVDTVHIGVIGIDIICRSVSINRTCSDMAGNAGTGDHDIWRHHDHTEHL